MEYDPYAPSQSHQRYAPSYPQPYPDPRPRYDSYDSQTVLYKDDNGSRLAAPAPVPGAAAADKDFDPFQPPPKSTGDLRIWRLNHHANLWTKGGRGRCFGRFCCCTIMITLFLMISILLTLLTFLRPPDIQFGGVQPSSDSSTAQSSSSDLKIQLGIVVSVRNPNFFDVIVPTASARVLYPVNSTQIGSGKKDNIVFPSNTGTKITFPFMFEYSPDIDSSGAVIKDIATKCGFVAGSVKQQLTLNYAIRLTIRVIFVTIPIPFSGSTQFDCPFSRNDLQPVVAAIPALSGLLDGG